MAKLFLLCLSISILTEANSIDKTKILEIIQAAKQHKAIQNTSKNTYKPIVVYTKPSGPKQEKQKVLGTLLSIPPSSVTLKNQYLSNESSKRKNNISLFKTPIQKKKKGENTTATRIKYY